MMGNKAGEVKQEIEALNWVAPLASYALFYQPDHFKPLIEITNPTDLEKAVSEFNNSEEQGASAATSFWRGLRMCIVIYTMSII